jgi:acyl transferase domain-containing protein
VYRYSFDSRANGYGRGEGVAAIVLKRLEDAVKSGDPIRAVIRDTHLNQDGKTETITSPSRHAQEQLIRECYEKADIDPSCTQYFEAHGTGTPTGDPIEVSAIASVFHEGRSCKRPLYIGSVKTNLGHTEPTSGLASVIKVTLALERKIIPPSINFEEPNERLTLDKWNLKVPVQCTSWPVGRDGTRRASVNNFGYGGANAHVIMEDWTLKSSIFSRRTMNRIVNRDQVGMIPPQLFILSAKDENSCRIMASNMEAYLRKHNPDAEKEAEFLNNFAFTLGERRSRFSWASVYQASSISELGAAFGNEKLVATRAGNRPRIGFIFTGQGAQWHAMGRELLDTYPVFKSSILEAEQYLKEFGCKWSLLQELCRDAETTRVAETLFGMPVCTAVQISLVRLLDVWGITPTAVCSHSSGEIAAAYAVGALSYRSAMAACYSRCEIGSELIEMDGGMIAVGLDLGAINDYLKIFNVGEAKIACINSPSSVTVSGDITAIEQLEVLLKGQGIFARRLRVRTAFHSHHMQPLYEPYMQSMQERMETGDQALLPIIYASPTTGMRVKDATQLSSPQHWAQSMIKPVLFLDAFRQMALNPVSGEAEIDIAVEVGPHAALSGPVGDILLMPEFCKTSISYLSCLIRDNNAVYTMQALAAQLLCKGVTVNLKGINFPTGKDHLSVITDLPSYPWNHQMRHWDECRANKSHRVKQFGYHDLIGSLVDGTNFLAPTWRHTIRLSDMPWVREHTVQSNVIYPGAGYICMAIEAARQLVTTTAQNINGYRLRDVDIMHALIIPDGARGVEVQLSLQSVSEKAIGVQGWREFKIYSVGAEDKWTEHCKGLILVEFLADSEPISHQKCSTLTLRPCYLKCVDPEDIYSSLRTNAIYHGKIFQNIESVQVGQSQAVVVLSIPNVACMMPEHYQKTHVLHPITLDSVFVSAYGALLGSNSKQESSIVPKRIKSLWVSGTIGSQHGHQFKSYVKIEHVDYRQFKSKITMFDSQEIDDSHPPVLVMDGFLCQSLGVAHCREPGPNNSDICSKLNWAPDISLMSPGVLSKQLSFALDTREEQTILNLRRACFHYIHDALASLTLADIQRLEWHHKKFYTWMKLQVNLALDDELAASSSEWIKDNEEEKRHLFDIVGLSSVNGEAVCHLGTHLLSILTQKATPLELLMEGKLLHKYYRGALKFSRCNIQLAKLAKHLIHKNPRAKILEIGAGTGGTTQSLLEVIGNGRKCGWGPFASEYHFTDISSGFFAESQDQYGDWSDIMTYRKLDIELDPAQQGFECGSYDIIVAGQVLHATKTMRSTMRNVRSLLKPGGKLLLMESTKDQMDMQFVFGLLPGWWLSISPTPHAAKS